MAAPYAPSESAALRNAEGLALDDSGRTAEAMDCYRSAAELDPQWAVPWFNMGLVHKYRAEWAESFEANRKTLARDPDHEGALWNLAIAATALGEWATARQAWRRCGIALPDGDGPIDYFIGLTPIRVSVDESPEVVWADRIDPARAVIRSVPLPATGRRCGDLVLHDGAPMGYRMLGGREVPVFNELAVLAPSASATFEVLIRGLSDRDVDMLAESAHKERLTVENWTASVRVLCKACSEGRPHDDRGHDHGSASNSDASLLRLGVAAPSQVRLREFLTSWRSGRPEVQIEDVRCVLAPGHLREVPGP